MKKTFKEIWKEMKEYEMVDEVDTLHTLMQVMRDNGFVYNESDFTILNLRGWMKSLKINRCGMKEHFHHYDVKYFIEQAFHNIKYISE